MAIDVMNDIKDTGTRAKNGTTQKKRGKGRPPKPKSEEDDATITGLAHKVRMLGMKSCIPSMREDVLV